MEFKHFAHGCTLTFREETEQIGDCFLCCEVVSGPAFICESCDHTYGEGREEGVLPASFSEAVRFRLHESCAKLPRKITHPLHPHHLLTLVAAAHLFTESSFICNGCKCFSSYNTSRFNCEECGVFNLDLKCGALMDDYFSKYDRHTLEEIDRKADMDHFSHQHTLKPCDFGKLFDDTCDYCDESIEGPGYVCLDCFFFIHESCAKFPREITHPLHPHHHPLTLVDSVCTFICGGCRDLCHRRFSFNCQECGFKIDTKCGLLMEGYYSKHDSQMNKKVDIPHFNQDHTLDLCNVREYGHNCSCCPYEMMDCSAYVCLQCDIYIHQSCAERYCEITHVVHPDHPLTLSVLDEDEKFICNGCKGLSYGRRFNCNECGYNLCFSCGSLMNNYFSFYDRQTWEEIDRNANIHHLSHTHTLTLCRNLSEFLRPYNCSYCDQIIDGSAYVCMHCDVYIHESCSHLPHQITHPLHPHHPLTLVLRNGNSSTCDACRVVSQDSKFSCNMCMFNLDVICASLMDDFFPQTSEKENRKININHFCHSHTLRLCNSTNLYKVDCSYCCQIIHGLTYVCRSCGFYIHESCKDQMPQKIQHPFHGEHILLLLSHKDMRICSACKEPTSSITFNCERCFIDLHPACAKAFARPLKLKHNLHQCPMFYFGNSSENFRCHICNGKGKHPSIYRCVDCDVNFHVECMLIPSVVEVKCHDHPLILLDSVKNSHFNDEYYCDICEEKGICNHHLYYCEDCIYIAHIECVITEDYILTVDSETKDKGDQDREKRDQVLARDEKAGTSNQVAHTLIKFLAEMDEEIGHVKEESSIVHRPSPEEEDGQDLDTPDEETRELQLEIGELTIKLAKLKTKLKLLESKSHKKELYLSLTM